jgi:hypothetical protein
MRINRATGALKEVISMEDDYSYRVSVQNGAFAKLEQERQLEKEAKGVQSMDTRMSDSKIATQQDVNQVLQQILDFFVAVSPNTYAPASDEAKD